MEEEAWRRAAGERERRPGGEECKRDVGLREEAWAGEMLDGKRRPERGTLDGERRQCEWRRDA